MTITVKQAESLMEGATLSEKMGGRGEGALLLVGRKGATVGYYRYTDPSGARPRIPVGTLGKTATLKQMRDKCAGLASLKRDHPDLKAWVDYQHSKDQEERALIEAAHRREDLVGSLDNLLSDYVASLLTRGATSATDVSKQVERLRSLFGELFKKKAKDVQAEDISDVLRYFSGRDALVMRNRVRSYLLAAYNYGLKHEFNETRESGRKFGLLTNPVAAIPHLDGAEVAHERALDDDEIVRFYRWWQAAESENPIVRAFFQLLIALGGQRPAQLLRVQWSDVDLERMTIKLEDSKGRGAKKRLHLLPLSERSLFLLADLKSVIQGNQGDASFIFAVTGEKPINLGSFGKMIGRFRRSVEGRPIEHFTVRDIRRSVKQLMLRHGMNRPSTNLLQNHGQIGVDITHYANNPEAFLTAKTAAMQQYADILEVLLDS